MIDGYEFKLTALKYLIEVKYGKELPTKGDFRFEEAVSRYMKIYTLAPGLAGALHYAGNRMKVWSRCGIDLYPTVVTLVETWRMINPKEEPIIKRKDEEEDD